jgi:hypothetical protein
MSLHQDVSQSIKTLSDVLNSLYFSDEFRLEEFVDLVWSEGLRETRGLKGIRREVDLISTNELFPLRFGITDHIEPVEEVPLKSISLQLRLVLSSVRELIVNEDVGGGEFGYIVDVVTVRNVLTFSHFKSFCIRTHKTNVLTNERIEVNGSGVQKSFHKRFLRNLN